MYTHYSNLEFKRTRGWEHRVHTEWQWPLSGVYSIMMKKLAQPDAEFLDEIQTKVLRVFLLSIHSHLYSLPWDLYFLKPTQPLTYFFKRTQPLMYFYSKATVHCKGKKEENLIENHSSFPMVSATHTETSSLRTLKIMPINLKEIVRSWIWLLGRVRDARPPPSTMSTTEYTE